jgi:dTDP-4-amino-4,6-dideoxygalactose transaminase
MGLAHLQYFDEEINLRTQAAIRYNSGIAAMESKGYGVHLPFLRLPSYCTRYNWQNYRIILDDCYNRDEVVDKMRKRGIGCKWDIQATHLEPCHRNAYNNVVLSITEHFHKNGMWIPFFAEITPEEQTKVLETLKDILS